MNKCEPFKAGYDSEGKHYVGGSHQFECSYYGGTLSPGSRFSNEEDCVRAAHIANIAYGEGYARAQRDIRAALGIG
jgi:hypothetical protein